MVAEKKYFLNVECSALGQTWLSALDRDAVNRALTITQSHGVPEQLSRVLAARDVDESEVEDFMNPTLRHLMPDPLSFTDMKVAASRITKAIQNKEKIAIFGDYDVDGACSSAVMARFLSFLGNEYEIYIPDRIVEGYGPNSEAMTKLVKNGARLIITVDCGANSAEAIKAARRAGSDVVVLDHHQMDSVHQEAVALVNPNRPDDLSGQGHLCAAGVVFIAIAQVCRQLRENKWHRSLPDILSYLDLVAFATVCDIVPLVGVNRAFVHKGLQVARAMHNRGLSVLAQVAKIGEPLKSFHFGYVLGPRVNAGGRIGDQALGARLLTCDHDHEALVMAEQLNKLNQERQAMEANQLAEADLMVKLENVPPVIVVANKDWHPGIVGLLAARLKERYQRPVFAIAMQPDGTAVGSGRSLSGFDLGAIVRRAVHAGYLEQGGGHAMAAGIRMQPEKIDAFKKWLWEQASNQISILDQQRCLKIDSVISASGATDALYHALEQAGPFGASNPAPVLVVMKHRLSHLREVGKGHLSLVVANTEGKSLKAIAFNAVGSPLGDFLHQQRGGFIHLAGHLSLNYWNGNTTPQMRVVDAALPVE